MQVWFRLCFFKLFFQWAQHLGQDVVVAAVDLDLAHVELFASRLLVVQASGGANYCVVARGGTSYCVAATGRARYCVADSGCWWCKLLCRGEWWCELL